MGDEFHDKRYLVCHGESVGIVAAQSIAEPCTQMVLRAVHNPGIESEIATTGLDRLDRLLDARKKTRAKVFTKVYLKEGIFKDAKKVKNICDAIREVKVARVAWIEEDFTNKAITIGLKAYSAKRHSVDLSLISESISKNLRARGRLAGNMIVIELRDWSLKRIRNLALKIADLKLKGISGTDWVVVADENADDMHIICSGSNIEAILRINEVDSSRIRTNDAAAMQKAFGIEAAGNMLREELKNVLWEHDISIGPAHLSLVADAVTSTGEALSLSKMVERKHSPIARSMFMAPLKELTNAAYSGETDSLRGVSERIAVGRRVHVGTGSTILNNGGNPAAEIHRNTSKESFMEQAETYGYTALVKPLVFIEQRSAEPVSDMHNCRNLGSIFWRKELYKRKLGGGGTGRWDRTPTDRKLKKAVLDSFKNRRLRYDIGEEGDRERRFDYALPILRACWGNMSLPHSVKSYSATIYRQCIRQDITRGRKVKAMAGACSFVAGADSGLKWSVDDVGVAANANPALLHRYGAIISEMIKVQLPQFILDPTGRKYIQKRSAYIIWEMEECRYFMLPIINDSLSASHAAAQAASSEIHA